MTQQLEEEIEKEFYKKFGGICRCVISGVCEDFKRGDCETTEVFKSFLLTSLKRVREEGFNEGFRQGLQAELDKHVEYEVLVRQQAIREVIDQATKLVASWHISKGGYTEQAWQLKESLTEKFLKE
jgi:hypothetical protein